MSEHVHNPACTAESCPDLEGAPTRAELVARSRGRWPAQQRDDEEPKKKRAS